MGENEKLDLSDIHFKVEFEMKKNNERLEKAIQQKGVSK